MVRGPKLFIIAGPNGAGKTTFAREFLPTFAECEKFINADLIAGGISPFNPESAAIRAGKLVLQEIHDSARSKISFGFESTLSGRNYLKLFEHFRDIGYQIHLLYLWLPSVDMAIQRVKDRVLHGGHSVKTEDVRRRYERSIKNFRHYRHVVDYWQVCDASKNPPDVLAYGAAEGSNCRDEETRQMLGELLKWHEKE